MKRFFIIVNSDKELAEETKQNIEKYLKSSSKDIEVAVWNGPKSDKYPIPDGTECIITVGGDGTLIQAARSTVDRKIPLIGINRGHMGYLTEIHADEGIYSALDRLIENDFDTEERMMLVAKVKRGKRYIYKDIALNEVLLGRHGSLHTIKFNVYVNNTLLNDYSADGMLVATPTGTTAYSLSAGGAIAKPQAKLIILTPICSHAMNARSIILPPEDKIKLVVCSDDQLIACDGDSVMKLEVGDEIYIEKSEHKTRFIKLKNESFLETLRDKMTVV